MEKCRVEECLLIMPAEISHTIRQWYTERDIGQIIYLQWSK